MKHLLFCLLFAGLASSAYGESMTLTTYYPAPAGSYKNLRSTTMCIGTICHNPALRPTVANNDLYVEGDMRSRAFFHNSDRRLKENIVPIENALAKTLALQGVSYNFKTSPDQKRLGLIAQDVEVIAPEVVMTDKEGMKSVEYGEMIGLLIEAIKEQNSIIQQQQQEINALKAKP
jgi:hypothetical protein